MSFVLNPITGELDLVRGKIGELTNVDESNAAQNFRLIYNGTQWVAVAEDTTFTFSINTFTDNESSTQLIGSGVWKPIDTIHFTQTYINGPPSSGHVALTSTGGVSWSSNLTLDSPFTTGSSAETTDYTNDKDKSVTFTLNANVGTTADTSAVSVTFRNNIKWGPVSGLGPYPSGTINSLPGTALSNDNTRSVTVNSTTGSFILFAHPSSYTTLNDAGFIFNSVICPFETPVIGSLTNGSIFTENYKVYRSTGSSLGNSTLITSTSDTTVNWIFFGTVSGTQNYAENAVEGLEAGSAASNTREREFTATAEVGSFILYAQPTRIGSVTFFIGGFEGGFQSPTTTSITNPNGFVEVYDTYRSTNAGLGATTVVVSGT